MIILLTDRVMKRTKLHQRKGLTMDIHTIHESLVNGQRKQMIKQIKEYGLYDFWADYHEYLFNTYVDEKARSDYFADTVISYHRITADPR